MWRWPEAQIITSLSPDSSMSTQIDSPLKADVEPLSIATAPPARSKVLLIREARVLVVKLPVSSISEGQRRRTIAKLRVDLLDFLGRHPLAGEATGRSRASSRAVAGPFPTRSKNRRRIRCRPSPRSVAIERFSIVAGVGQGLLGRFEEHELQRVGFGDLLGRRLWGCASRIESR